MPPMATESPTPTSSSVLVPDLRTFLYGITAAGGTLALLNGIQSYQEYAGNSFGILLSRLSGTVARGVDHARGE